MADGISSTVFRAILVKGSTRYPGSSAALCWQEAALIFDPPQTLLEGRVAWVFHEFEEETVPSSGHVLGAASFTLPPPPELDSDLLKKVC